MYFMYETITVHNYINDKYVRVPLHMFNNVNSIATFNNNFNDTAMSAIAK